MRSLTSIALALALTTLASQGQISFGPSQEISNFINYPLDTRAVDMDGDGDLDVISREALNVKVIWWENDGDGNFPNRHVWTWGNINSRVLSLDDANADGLLDVWIRTRISPDDEPQGKETYRYFVALGDQEGGFGEPQPVGDFDTKSYATSKNRSVRVSDMNQDGRADLLMPDGIWLRQTDGTFQPPAVGGFQLGTQLREFGGEDYNEGQGVLVIDDFDGDGDQDLAFGAPGLRVSFNLGDGMLSVPVSASFMRPNEKVDYLKSIPSVPGETRARLLVSSSLEIPGSDAREPRLALGAFSATGDFTAAAVEPFEPHVYAITWDAGGNRAIIASESGPAPGPAPEFHAPLDIAAFALPSAGTSFIRTSLFQADGMVKELAMADLDGDGIADLLLPLSSYAGYSGPFLGELRWYRQNGSGEYSQHQPSISQPALGGGISYAGDVDGDGDVDVITRNHPIVSGGRINSPGYLTVTLWENQGSGTLFKRRVLSEGHHAVDIITVSDCDGDGDPDVLIQTYDILGGNLEPENWGSYGTFRLAWLIQDEHGAFLEDVKYEGSSIGLLHNAEYLDWDGLPQSGDGPPLPDVVGVRPTTVSQKQAVYFRGVGTGFEAAQTLATEDDIYIGAWDDLDRDGDPDFRWVQYPYNNSPVLGFWMRNDHGAAAPAEPLPGPFFSLEADVDGDGFNDYFGDGTTLLLSRPGLSSETMTIPGIPEDPSFIDMDSDGDLDIIFSQRMFGISHYAALGWYENDGAKFRQALPVTGGTWGYSRDHVMADIDGDGIKDLVVQLGNEPKLEWFKVSKRQAPAEFSGWMASTGLKGGLAGPLSDGDEDGATNWEEFVFGSDPAVLDRGHSGRPRLEKQGNAWAYSYQRRVGLASPPKVQTSTDLKIWNDAAPATPSAQPAAPGYEWISEESNGEDALFFRTVIPNP